MRGIASTLILVVVLAGLGGYIYFVDSKKPATAADDAAPKTKLFTVEAEKIDELKITTGGETSLLKKGADGWKMVQPSESDADPAEVISVAQAISTLEMSRTVDENPADLKEYGLATPTVSIEFKAGGNVSGSFALGDKTPTSADIYGLKGGDKKVFLVPGFQETPFTKKPFDLRDKKILKFDRDKADSLSFVKGSETLDLARAGSDWKVVKPVAGRSDYSTVEGFLTRLATSNMTKIVDADGKDLAKYGLDKPSMTITLGAGSAKTVLQVGKVASEIFAKDASRPIVFSVDTTLQDDLNKNFDVYRKKELFEFRPFSLLKLRAVLDVPGGQKIYEFAKVKAAKAGDPDVWKVTKQGGPTLDVTDAAMDEMTGKLVALKIDAFTDAKTKTGIDKPALVISVSYDDGKFERVRFGEVAENAFGARDGEATGKIEKSAMQGAMMAIDAIVMPPPPAPPTAPPAAVAPAPGNKSGDTKK